MGVLVQLLLLCVFLNIYIFVYSLLVGMFYPDEFIHFSFMCLSIWYSNFIDLFNYYYLESFSKFVRL